MKPLPLRQLLTLMLLLDILGVVAFMVHTAQPMHIDPHASFTLLIGQSLWLLVSFLSLLLPVALLGAASALVYRRFPFVATFAGLLSAVIAVIYLYILGDPKYNQDANIGLGWYFFFGALYPLGPAWLFGGVVGQIFSWLNGNCSVR